MSEPAGYRCFLSTIQFFQTFVLSSGYAQQKSRRKAGSQCALKTSAMPPDRAPADIAPELRAV
jgi:hypothetical protein